MGQPVCNNWQRLWTTPQHMHTRGRLCPQTQHSIARAVHRASGSRHTGRHCVTGQWQRKKKQHYVVGQIHRLQGTTQVAQCLYTTPSQARGTEQQTNSASSDNGNVTRHSLEVRVHTDTHSATAPAHSMHVKGSTLLLHEGSASQPRCSSSQNALRLQQEHTQVVAPLYHTCICAAQTHVHKTL